jgi:hypothetical protein
MKLLTNIEKVSQLILLSLLIGEDFPWSLGTFEFSQNPPYGAQRLHTVSERKNLTVFIFPVL